MHRIYFCVDRCPGLLVVVPPAPVVALSFIGYPTEICYCLRMSLLINIELLKILHFRRFFLILWRLFDQQIKRPNLSLADGKLRILMLFPNNTFFLLDRRKISGLIAHYWNFFQIIIFYIYYLIWIILIINFWWCFNTDIVI